MFQQSYHLCHSVIDSACECVCACACVRARGLLRVCVCVYRLNISGSVPLLDPLLITTLSWMIYSSLWISCVWFCLSRGTWTYKYNRAVYTGVSFHLCFRNLRLAWGWIHNLPWSPPIIFLYVLYVILISFNLQTPLFELCIIMLPRPVLEIGLV